MHSLQEENLQRQSDHAISAPMARDGEKWERGGRKEAKKFTHPIHSQGGVHISALCVVGQQIQLQRLPAMYTQCLRVIFWQDNRSREHMSTSFCFNLSQFCAGNLVVWI